MAFRPLLRLHAVPAALGTAAGIAVVAPRRQAFAEASDAVNGPAIGSTKVKKPIYDSPNTLATPEDTKPGLDESNTPPGTAAKSPSPTDRLTRYVRIARLELYNLSSGAEDAFNGFLSRVLSVENDFTSTVASLAPPPSANEQLLPGIVYILVSTMAGTILTRNRNLLLRFTVPLGLGIGTAYAVLPFTMRNVGDLVWRYEEQYPAVRDAHLATRERIERFWETGKSHSAATVHMAEEKLGEAREKVEDWVRKGK